jgi:hypothetical protein
MMPAVRGMNAISNMPGVFLQMLIGTDAQINRTQFVVVRDAGHAKKVGRHPVKGVHCITFQTQFEVAVSQFERPYDLVSFIRTHGDQI